MARSSACLKIQKCSAHFALLTRSRCSRSLVLVRGCITMVWQGWGWGRNGELTRTQWFAVSFGWFLDCAVTLCNKEFSWPLERLRLPSEDILIESVAEKDDDANADAAADAEEDADLRYLGSCVRIKCGSLCPCYPSVSLFPFSLCLSLFLSALCSHLSNGLLT